MKKRAKILIGAGCVLLSASLALAVNNQVETVQAAKSAQSVAQAFLSNKSVLEARVIEVSANDDNSLHETGAETPAPAPAEPVVIDGQKYIGLLSIPTLGLNLPVNNDLTLAQLRKTPCRYYGEESADNLIIAAHNYNTHFGKIGALKPGDSVNLTDAGGVTQAYAVSEILTLPGNAADEMKRPGDWDLTLFTCNYAGTERVTVRCIKGDRV